MKALSAPAATVTQRQWARPVLLAQIDFTTPSAFTLRMSDAPRVALGEEWQPLVADWGNVESVLNTLDMGGRPATAELGLFNARSVDGTNRARLSDTMRSPFNTSAGAYEWAFARVTITQLLDERHEASDAVGLGVFYLEDPTDVDERILRVRMVDASLALEDKQQLTKVTRISFPNADPDAIGRTIPVPIGRVTKVPTLAVVAGATATLATNITPATPNFGQQLSVSDTAAFPSSGLVQIDDEQILYSSKSTNALVVQARGAAGTVAAAHATGALVWEIRSGSRAYRYLVGENRAGHYVQSVTNVQANGVLQPQATVDYDDQTLMPGRSFVVISFAALPVLKRQVLLSVQDTIGVNDGVGVNDTIKVNDGLNVQDNIGVSTSSRTTITRIATNTPLTITATRGSSTPGAMSNGVGDLFIAPPPPGMVWNVNRKIIYRVVQSNVATSAWFIQRGFGAAMLEQGTSSPPSLGSRTFAWSTGAAFGNDQIWLTGTGSGPGSIQIIVDSYEETLEMDISIQKSGAAFRSGGTTKGGAATKTGTVVKVGTVALTGNSTADVVVGDVTCDVNGLRDDASGTISGTPYLLLENPADVAKLILLQLFPGITTADLGSTWATTRALLGGYQWAGLLEDQRFSELRAQLGAQARSVLYLEAGRWEFKFLADKPDAQVVLDYARDVWAEAPARVSRTPLAELRNTLWMYSARDYQRDGSIEEMYTRASQVKDTANTVADEIQESIALPLVQDAATALALGSWHLERRKRQRFQVSLVAWWNVVALDQADYVAIKGHPVLDHHGGQDLVFQVVTRRYNLGDEHPGRIALELIQLPVVPTPARMLLPVPGSQLSSAVVTFQWTEGFDVSAYTLNIGSSPGASDYHASGEIHATARTVTLPTFSTPGPVYVRLYSLIAGVWVANDYTYQRAYSISGTGAFITPRAQLAGSGGVLLTGTGAFITPGIQISGGDAFWVGPDSDLFWGPDADLFWELRANDTARFIAPTPRLGGVGTVSLSGAGAFITPGVVLFSTDGGSITDLFWASDSALHWDVDAALYW